MRIAVSKASRPSSPVTSGGLPVATASRTRRFPLQIVAVAEAVLLAIDGGKAGKTMVSSSLAQDHVFAVVQVERYIGVALEDAPFCARSSG